MTTASIPTQASADSALSLTILTVDQVAKRLYVGRSTVYNMVKSGEIFSVRFGRIIRIPRNALNEYISKKIESKSTLDSSTNKQVDCSL